MCYVILQWFFYRPILSQVLVSAIASRPETELDVKSIQLACVPQGDTRLPPHLMLGHL